MIEAHTRPVWVSAIFLLLCSGAACAGRAQAADLRLYALDCGHAVFKDLSGFSTPANTTANRAKSPCRVS